MERAEIKEGDRRLVVQRKSAMGPTGLPVVQCNLLPSKL